MKKLWDVLVLLLALNFLAIAGAAGWLYQSGHVDRDRAKAIKEILFPPPQAASPTTQPATTQPSHSPTQRLDELLARHTGGHSAAEQLEFLHQTFDATMVELDRRQREVQDLEQQLADGNRKLTEDRAALEAERQRLADREKEADRLANDKGFQDTLTLYQSMAAKQVKEIFMGMDDALAAQYLDAMPPRSASKITREFKTQPEVDRLKRIVEKMRHSDQASAPTTAPAGKEG